ncbi:hypothetical protein BV22DRAFT_396316 [Leucogyrophana mollusca]|uniref:Uncharacterized protein n=1 Tax=Leucogyrophana mollusca TaxID=85980 RepID=A0ACB8BKN8_9AGAM|nr:hypothetical protein BV22DRAFT_396316 [Leucogyrophana mollusca]
MLYDGMGYFVLLTVTNTVNLILYRTIAPIQAAAVTVGYVVTWIMSQKLLINLHEAQVHHRMANAVATGASIASQFHEHTDTKSNSSPNHSCGISPPSRKPDEWTVPDFDCEAEGDNQLDVRVRMERVIGVRVVLVLDLWVDIRFGPCYCHLFCVVNKSIRTSSADSLQGAPLGSEPPFAGHVCSLRIIGE